MTDSQMPLMDGFKATRRIRRGEGGPVHREITIVAMTANALAGDRDKCLQVGMNDYVSKPLRRAEVERILQQAAERSIAS